MKVKHRQSEIHEMLLYDDDNNKKLFEKYKNLQIHDDLVNLILYCLINMLVRNLRFSCRFPLKYFSI